MTLSRKKRTGYTSVRFLLSGKMAIFAHSYSFLLVSVKLNGVTKSPWNTANSFKNRPNIKA